MNRNAIGRTGCHNLPFWDIVPHSGGCGIGARTGSWIAGRERHVVPGLVDQAGLRPSLDEVIAGASARMRSGLEAGL